MLEDTRLLFKKHPVGTRFEVKATPILRRYGIHCGTGPDNRLWPGEIGTVTYTSWTCRDGSTNDAAYVQFPRDRRISLETALESCKRLKAE